MSRDDREREGRKERDCMIEREGVSNKKQK